MSLLSRRRIINQRNRKRAADAAAAAEPVRRARPKARAKSARKRAR